MTMRTSECGQPAFTTTDMLQLRAEGFIARHEGEHLHNAQLYARCVEHIQELADVSTLTAQRIAGRAMAEYQSRGISLYIDVDECTRSQLALRDARTRELHVITLARLAQVLNLLKPAERAN